MRVATSSFLSTGHMTQPSALQPRVSAPRGERRLRRVAVVGGGTAGWMAAAMLKRALHNLDIELTVVESAEIGTVGVGEATIPPIIDLLTFLDINEADFIRRTQATFKLGIVFEDWSHLGGRYWHPFGAFGAPIGRRPFVHSWHRAVAEGLSPSVSDFSLCAALGDQGRFRKRDPDLSSIASGLRYALHFDAGLVAQYLRAYAEHLGAKRIERTVVGVDLAGPDRIEALRFFDGGRLEADLFIDCTGFQGLLIEGALKAGYEDWSEWLPCDRAVAAPSAIVGPRPPYTEARALEAGWRWRIPLQHRVGNGYVYSSRHLSDDEAADQLRRTTNGALLAEPRQLRFVAGRRRKVWKGNCVALGLSSGFLEPLESTSIQLIMNGVYNLLDRFPDLDFDPHNIAAYNAELEEDIERIRDFIILHYALTAREDTAFWRERRGAKLPASLQERIDLYQATGRIKPKAGELFTDLSWFYVFEGMGVRPRAYDPLADVPGAEPFGAILSELSGLTRAAARQAPLHDTWLGASEASTTSRAASS